MTAPADRSVDSSPLKVLETENRELRALLDASLGLQGELSLDLVLQQIVDEARDLIGSKYGALSVINHEDLIEQFITSGVDAEHRQRIGLPPTGAGLLGVPLQKGESLQLADLGRDPRSRGFPEHHPPMHSLLAVPIICRSPHRGNLYLAERLGAAEFTESDLRTLHRFSLAAASVIDTAHVHQRLESLAIAEERLRISREIHDGVAQVLAYVNTKAQAARELIQSGNRGEGVEQLDQLASAARGVYSEVRESILGLRLQPGADRSLKDTLIEYAELWRQRSTSELDLAVADDLDLAPEAELQLMRIVQEGLANVRKHARAKRIQVALTREGDQVSLSIEDDGRGFIPGEKHPSGAPRFGLSVMRERAEGIGGRFKLISTPGGGTRLLVRVPRTPASGSNSKGSLRDL